jgi:hypothetical protein
MSSEKELSAVIFGQHIHLILILVNFFSWGCLRDKVYSSNPRTEEQEENICKDISNIPAEHLQKVNQNLFCQCKQCLPFIPNVIDMLSHQQNSRALCRAVNASSLLKNTLYKTTGVVTNNYYMLQAFII